MVEVSLTEIAMLVWAGLATAAWLSAREDARIAKKMLHLFIENKDAREQIVKAHEEFMRKQEIKPKFDVVLVRPDKTVYIPHTDTKNPKEVNDIELLPESTRNSVALLKLVGSNQLLPEVGYRAGENTYFILV